MDEDYENDNFDDELKIIEEFDETDKLEDNEKEEQENIEILTNIPSDEFNEKLKNDPKKRKKNTERITFPYMTKYELARILGTRSLQITTDSPVQVELNGETDPLKIAKKELKHKKVPITIRRYLPDGSYEDWGANELIVFSGMI